MSTQESSASSIAVLGSDVYVAGRVSNGTQSIACYWKNGIFIELSENANVGGFVVVARQ